MKEKKGVELAGGEERDGRRTRASHSFGGGCWLLGVPKRDRLACRPNGESAMQIVRVMKRYLAKNPGKAHRTTRYIASLALAGAFPCRGGKVEAPDRVPTGSGSTIGIDSRTARQKSTAKSGCAAEANLDLGHAKAEGGGEASLVLVKSAEAVARRATAEATCRTSKARVPRSRGCVRAMRRAWARAAAERGTMRMTAA